MRIINAVIFEPVGCLAEFRADEFKEISEQVLKAAGSDSTFGSVAYWEMLEQLKASWAGLTPAEWQRVQQLELRSVEHADAYEDVVPSLADLQSMGITLLIASSLSGAAVDRFLDRFALRPFFSGVWTRDNAGGIHTRPVSKAMEAAGIPPEHTMVLADAEQGLDTAKAVGANSILMINDYDQGRKLSMHPPAGGLARLQLLVVPVIPSFIAITSHNVVRAS